MKRVLPVLAVLLGIVALLCLLGSDDDSEAAREEVLRRQAAAVSALEQATDPAVDVAAHAPGLVGTAREEADAERAASAEEDAPTPEERTFSGRVVVAPEKTPFAGAEIVVLVSVTGYVNDQRAEIIARAVTGDDGTYALTAMIPPGMKKGWLEVLAPGYALRRYTFRSLRRGDVRKVLLTAPGGTVTGTLVRDDGGGVAGARVWLVGWGGAEGTDLTNAQGLPRPVRAAEDGSFELAQVPHGKSLILSARADDGAQGRTRPFLVTRSNPELHDVILPLLLTGEIRGRIIDSQGQPWEGARIALTSQDLLRAGSGTRAVKRGGTFRITNMAEGGYVLQAFHVGWGGGRVLLDEVLIDAGTVHELGDLVVGSGQAVSGRLVPGDGTVEDLPGLLVRLRQGDAYRTARCDPEGRFRFTNVGPGTWALRLGDGPYRVVGPVDVVPGTEGLVVDIVASSATLALDVTSAGGEALDPSLLIDVYFVEQDVSDPRDCRSGQGEEGTFLSDPLPPGAYEVFVEVAGYALWRRPLTLAAGEISHWAVRLDPAPRLARRVVAPSGKPVSGALVVLSVRNDFPLGPVNLRVGDVSLMDTRTDAQGRFDLPVSRPDLLLSVVARAEHAGLRLPVRDLPEGDLVLPEAHTVRGRLTDAEGEGLPRVRVRLDLAASRSTPHRSWSASQEGGAFSFGGVAPGVWRLRVHGHEGQVILEVPITIGDTDVDLGAVPLSVSGGKPGPISSSDD